MATVEQCESSALSTISKALNLFDAFKSSQDEEKDSDEESFHLPLLDCDDDMENSTSSSPKEPTAAIKEVNGGETEDDILNKFESNCTPDIDLKGEERILEEIDNLLEKKCDENKIETRDNDSKDISVEDSISNNEKENKGNQSVSDTSKDQPDEKVDEESINDNEYVSLDNTILSADVHIRNETDEDKILNENEENKECVEKTEPEDKINEDLDVNKLDCGTDNKIESGIPKDLQLDDNILTGGDVDSVDEGMNEQDISEPSAAIEEKVEDMETGTERDLNVDDLKNTPEESNMNAINTEPEATTTDETKEHLNGECSDAMEVDTIEEKQVEADICEENNDILNEIPDKSNDFCENSTEDKVAKLDDNVERNIDELPCVAEEDQTVDNTKEKDSILTEKCENSNDSSKSQNLECEDLLDISVIRDADEDNASAIEENAKDVQASEKSDDNDDQDEGSDKAENELDESELEQEDTLTEKDDNMDFEDGSSSLCDQDNGNSGNISDSDSKGTNSDMKDLEDSSKGDSNVLKQKNDFSETRLTSEKGDMENVDIQNASSDTASQVDPGHVNEDLLKSKGKRSLSETEISDGPSKKMKLLESSKVNEEVPPVKNNTIKTLVNFEKYMQNKKLKHKLTVSDLEQFCLQKICEVILHKTDVGELHQTIKKQEQIIESLRKDLQQLTKQTRDLDIVNKKLMGELKTQNGSKKPLVPLKITRSVGLQVKLNASVETNNRRKGPSVSASPRTPIATTTSRTRTITPNSAVVRQIGTSPRKTATAPLLSQALQKHSVTSANNVTRRQPIRPKPTESSKPANASVIDLTDEDENRAAKGAVGNSVKIINKTVTPLSQGKTINIIPAKTVANKTLNSNQNKTITVGQVKTGVSSKVATPTRTVSALPQGVRLTPTQVKGGGITIPASVVTSSNAGTTQLMYVVQPGSVVNTTAGGTQKAVLLNFQPANGVLTSTLNGSAVSVLPTKTTNTVQLKTVAAPRKHPAPLPSPPSIALNASLKPLLPKPHLSIRKTETGIILQWRMPYNLDIYEAIASYQLFAYQETNAAPNTEMWRKVGDVKALALPMACTLTQFADKNKYYFAVRSVDVHKRIGAFSDPEEISL